MFNSNGLSPADVVALNGSCGGYGYGGGAFGDGNWLWFIIVIVALFGGWNNGGIFGGFGGGSGVTDGYILQSDFAQVESKLDSVNNGICSLGYDQLAQMNGINQNISNSTNALSTQIADCCCTTKQMLADINYNIATQSCATNSAIKDGVNAIIQNDNANYRALHDEIVANRMEDYKTQIANQQAEINALQLSASQQCQNAYLLSQLKPQPVPSFPAQNLYGYYYGTTIA